MHFQLSNGVSHYWYYEWGQELEARYDIGLREEPITINLLKGHCNKLYTKILTLDLWISFYLNSRWKKILTVDNN